MPVSIINLTKQGLSYLLILQAFVAVKAFTVIFAVVFKQKQVFQELKNSQ